MKRCQWSLKRVLRETPLVLSRRLSVSMDYEMTLTEYSLKKLMHVFRGLRVDWREIRAILRKLHWSEGKNKNRRGLLRTRINW